MAENSHLYRPDALLHNGRTNERYTNAALSLGIGQERTVPADLARYEQLHGTNTWGDHMSNYTQNLGLPTNLNTFSSGQFNSQTHELNSRVPPTRDRERRDGPSHTASNALDMSMPRTQNYLPTVHSSEHLPSPSRNQRSFLSSQAPPYVPRGSSYPTSAKNAPAPHANNRTSDVAA